MRLKGSVTIEASVLIPIFTLIVVQLVILALNCHDRVIINCAADKVCMRYEFEKPIKKDNNKKDDLSRELNAYIAVKSISVKPSVQIKKGLLKVETEYSRITQNNPVQFVWETDAVEKLVHAGGDK